MTAPVLIAVTHLLGSGHLVRAAHLARALAAAGHPVTLASGGMPLRLMAGEPFAFVQLPPVKIEGTDFRNLLDERGVAIDDDRRATRQAMLVDLATRLRPVVVITEHFPFGRRQLAQEFLALIAAAKAANPAALILSSIRDVLVTPRANRVAEAHARIAGHFDGVLIHGDAAFLPLEASWPVTPELAGRLHYTGYMAAKPTAPHPEEAAKAAVSKERPVYAGASFETKPAASPQDEGGNKPGDILVSGGGSGAALPLFEAAIAAARLLDPDQRWRILVGRATDSTAFDRLAATAPDHVAVEWARPDFPALLAACALSVSQAGYNTVLDLIAARRPAIVVPFDAGAETEQAIRAGAMARTGLARCLCLSGDRERDASALATAAAEGLSAGPPASLALNQDGASGAVAAIARLLSARR